MDAVILALCCALTLVLLAALIVSCVRLKINSRELKEEQLERLEPPVRVVIVKQSAGIVRFAYLTEPNEEAPEEEIAVAEAADDRDVVVIPRSEKLTFEELYRRLPDPERELLDAFTAYLTQQPDCDSIVRTNALCYRYKKSSVAKAVIRRDLVILRFSIANPNLGRFVREEKPKNVKVQPAEIRLSAPDGLALAKQTADLTIGYLKGEEEYRSEKRREARREARRRQEQEEDGQ